MNATILCYHKVGPEAEEGRRLNIEPLRLESHLRYFLRRGRRIVRASDIGTGDVCFSFDDAYASTLNHALPIFDKYKVALTLYVVSSLVGKTSEWDGELARPLADWDALIAAYRSGHEIGNHTASHPHLTSLTAERAMAEVTDADAVLREKGLNPSSFCYPYGSYEPSMSAFMRDLNYRTALTLRKPVSSRQDDLLELPRTVLAFSDTVPMLIYKTVIRPRLRR